MIKVVSISLENEMDLVLAHKRSMKVAERLALTVATQTTFATAVSEIARSVIEQTDNGTLDIGLEQNKQRYNLVCMVAFDCGIRFTNDDAGFHYAQKLVPEFFLDEGPELNVITMKLGLPRSLKLDPIKINLLQKYFDADQPLNPYEEIKKRNVSLHKIAGQKDEELRQSRLIDEKKTEFISIASHEFKTPITIIKAYTQIAKKIKPQTNDQVTSILDKIDAQASKLQSLVMQLLDVSKMENGSLQYNMEQVEMNQFIENMIDIQRHILPDHAVVFDVPASVTVFIDRLRMEQVFSNLLGNAAKYSQKNTKIYIGCRKELDGFLTISVADEGIGMSARSIDSIFEKFYRDEDVIKTHAGLGMGLYISSKIINDHGGKIWVKSTENVGSTFYFTIPIQ
ncbi:sensor histidine kinase [Daejeonella lutea]|uniref:histidine kinase n=1 Tax=Daejeonella lutea TaxID=572036 RepID=A0A1T5BNR8_9SPHI|nr:sensor histidine kinase [Daejeonella lutea]SKB48858.1 Signal transduction histidine kinase [Daejeonella lutea]